MARRSFSQVGYRPLNGGRGGPPYFETHNPWFDRPFDNLTALSKDEGSTALSGVEGQLETRNTEPMNLKDTLSRKTTIQSFWWTTQAGKRHIKSTEVRGQKTEVRGQKTDVGERED